MNGTLIDTLAGLSREMDELLPNLREVVCAELLDAQRGLESLSRKVIAAQVELDAAVAENGARAEHGYASLRGCWATCTGSPLARPSPGSNAATSWPSAGH